MTNAEKKYYLSKFKGKTFVVKIGGEVIQSKETLTNILTDIKNLFEYGINIILVHGGGPQVDNLSNQLGHKPQKVNGRRITSDKDLEVCKMLFGGTLNLEILSIFKKIGVNGIRVSGLDGGLLEVNLRCKKDIDYGHVGDIKKVNTEILTQLLDSKHIPVVSPLAAADDGSIVNINADTVATSIATELKAEKLILMTNVEGVYNDKDLISILSTNKAKQLIENDIINKGMAIKTKNCISAVENGVKRVHILNGLSPHSLLNETFTKRGTGTMIVSDKEAQIYLSEKS